MKRMKNKKKIVFVLSITAIFTMGLFLPITQAEQKENKIMGLDKGPSHYPMTPIKKATFVNYDENTFLDDYAYLAAVPTAVFKDKDNLYSHPLLYYQDYQYGTREEKTLNPRQGLDYFMEDWMEYCDQQMDSKTLINVPEIKTSTWKSKDTKIINSNNPAEIASKLALNEWSYSDDAVIAVNAETKYSDSEIQGSVQGNIEANNVEEKRFILPQINIITPQFEDFTVPDGYTYMKARLWWECFYFSVDMPGGFFQLANISSPAGDPNLELFCRHKDKWMQVAATLGWNQKSGMDLDYTGSYIYETGPWRVAVTDVPTHSANKISQNIDSQNVEKHHNIGPVGFGRYGTFFEALKNSRNVQYKVDITMFPGTIVELPDVPMHDCDEAEFKLTWDNPDVNLGLTVIGPGGEEVLSVSNESRTDNQEMILKGLGECLKDEKYKVSVFAMDDISSPVDFKVEYVWKQGLEEKSSSSLTSATEGAVLASQLNAPMLYIESSKIPKVTQDVLYKLGVKNIYLVDINNNIKKQTSEELSDICEIKKHFKVLENIYDYIREDTDSTDIVFSTFDPWSYWVIEGLKPEGEFPGGLQIGPAAFTAAHHGTPVLLVENHPQLSSSVTWHTEFWRRMASQPGSPEALPSVSEMYITGNRVYDFLDEIGWDKEGEESMITVAGQYDIGVSWDRAFFGKAYPGRFFGSPVDTSYWISRNVFYPYILFVNPAMKQQGIELINGSESSRRFPWRTSLGLKITKESEEEHFTYPVLNTYLCYNHRFNERASKYWGWKYTCADGMIPGESPSFEAIDDGVCEKYYGKKGAYFPDFTDSEIIPLYQKRGGYDNVFSTAYDEVIENLNRGVIMWMGIAHGGDADGGTLLFWDPDNPLVHEDNPWRGYEWRMGSTEEPDTMSMDDHGFIPSLFTNPTGRGLTGQGFLRTNLDYALAKKPMMDLIANIPIVKHLLPSWWQDTQDYYDGVVGSIFVGTLHQRGYNGTTFDETLDNLHSAAVINGCCLLSTKYIQLVWIRHGSVFQILDPWPTSWYTSWHPEIPRNIALGNTIGEAFVEGLSHVGILYLTGQWWADIKQNVCLWGDPDIRPFVPSTKYSDDNYWTEEETKPVTYDSELNINGHMPFGATEYPNEREQGSLITENIVLIVVSLVIIGLIILIAYSFKKEQK